MHCGKYIHIHKGCNYSAVMRRSRGTTHGHGVPIHVVSGAQTSTHVQMQEALAELEAGRRPPEPLLQQLAQRFRPLVEPPFTGVRVPSSGGGDAAPAAGQADQYEGADEDDNDNWDGFAPPAGQADQYEGADESDDDGEYASEVAWNVGPRAPREQLQRRTAVSVIHAIEDSHLPGARRHAVVLAELLTVILLPPAGDDAASSSAQDLYPEIVSMAMPMTIEEYTRKYGADLATAVGTRNALEAVQAMMSSRNANSVLIRHQGEVDAVAAFLGISGYYGASALYINATQHAMRVDYSSLAFALGITKVNRLYFNTWISERTLSIIFRECPRVTELSLHHRDNSDNHDLPMKDFGPAFKWLPQTSISALTVDFAHEVSAQALTNALRAGVPTLRRLAVHNMVQDGEVDEVEDPLAALVDGSSGLGHLGLKGVDLIPRHTTLMSTVAARGALESVNFSETRFIDHDNMDFTFLHGGSGQRFAAVFHNTTYVL